jgi:hypothetical protein
MSVDGCDHAPRSCCVPEQGVNGCARKAKRALGSIAGVNVEVAGCWNPFPQVKRLDVVVDNRRMNQHIWMATRENEAAHYTGVACTRRRSSSQRLLLAVATKFKMGLWGDDVPQLGKGRLCESWPSSRLEGFAIPPSRA